ncbi:MAG: hypothetical protein HFH93_03115 [Lachnospiraceae bacterium]|nr:hypothetical protein [Lachnospiraceae bacterium]
MYSYSIVEWLFFFYFYCFVGWCIESAYVSVRTRKLTNRGFMRGPFLPLYGSGAIMMLVVSMPFQDNIFMVYVAGCIGATALEYVTGVAMEALFKVRYWDYSKNKFQFQGHICLGTSLSWGFLTILMTEVVHVPVEGLAASLPDMVLRTITIVVTIYIAADFALSFKAAIDLRDVLVKMEKVKEEMVHIQKRLDMVVALTRQEMENYKTALTESAGAAKEEWTESMAMRIEDVKAGIERKLEQVRALVPTWSAEQRESIGEVLLDLKTKYAVNLADRKRLGKLRDFFQRGLLRSNPGMTSVRFREALEELKRRTMGEDDEEQD